MRLTPLHYWIAGKIGCEESLFDVQALERYQLQRLREVVSYTRQRSPFYRERFKDCPLGFNSLSDLTQYPFTSAEDLQPDPSRFVCVSQEDIHRIVSLPTSGTTGKAKRIFFSAADQNLTIDFFRVGMSTLAEAGDRVLILLPGERPGSVGDLLYTALGLLGCIPYKYGPVDEEEKVLQFIVANHINLLVGAPVHLHRLACWDAAKSIIPSGQIRAVLTSTDTLPSAIRIHLEESWGCEVFDHYGMTETGLGGGVECEAHEGYHLREADLFFEIIDPHNGRQMVPGEEGEVVVTTLTRNAMPLIRFRTGDISRWLPRVCACGSFIRRLEAVRCRLSTGITIGNGTLHQSDLDEVIFKVRGVSDFSATLQHEQETDILKLDVKTIGYPVDRVKPSVLESVTGIPVLQWAMEKGELDVIVSEMVTESPRGPAAMIKRQINDMRKHGN